MNIKLSEFRYTRNLARSYRAAVQRQEGSFTEWREDGIDALIRELNGALTYWRKQYGPWSGDRIYNRATAT